MAGSGRAGGEQEETWGTREPRLGSAGGTERGKVGGSAGPGVEQHPRRRTLPPALAEGRNQKGDYCFTAVLMH